MAAGRGTLADNQMGIQVGLLETRQETLCSIEELWSMEEGWLQVEHIYREEKLNVSNAFRTGNIRNYLSQWNSITSERLLSKLSNGYSHLTL